MALERLDSKSLFLKALRDGINLFCGAGFSVLAKDKTNKDIPLGNTMLDELKKMFLQINTYTKLSYACTKINKLDKKTFNNYLENRFDVESYDNRYDILNKVSIKNVYTTNIDNLFFKIFNNKDIQINDVSVRGKRQDKNNFINYFPLHGCINNHDNYVFDNIEIINAFVSKSNDIAWKELARDASKNAILFWGWNFEDTGPIQAMYKKTDVSEKNITKWIMLHKPTEESIDYFELLGFKIIIGDTSSMLDFIVDNVDKILKEEHDDVYIKRDLLLEYSIPKEVDINHYPFKNMFLEYSTEWSHIYSGQVCKTSHYYRIEEQILNDNNLIIYGMRGVGKTTLLKQLLAYSRVRKVKHYMDSPTLEDAKTYARKLNGNKSILFIDNCFRDTDAIKFLGNCNNIQLVGFDRDFNFESQYEEISYLMNTSPIDVSILNEYDPQDIINSIPRDILLNISKYPLSKITDKDRTIPYLLIKYIRLIHSNFIRKFYNDDKEAAEIFVLICYVHSCGTACSFDMIYSYLGSDKYHWKEMMDIIKRVGDWIQSVTDENVISLSYNQDYYECRSRFFAENIIGHLKKSDKEILSKVIMKFITTVPVYKIYNYDFFKKSAYDSDLSLKIFDKKKGEEFYNIATIRDGSEYVYQQAALYFAGLKDYIEAFKWIDKARNLTRYNRFSIDSTYARIYFSANLKKSKELSIEALDLLNESCKQNKRKGIHFLFFADAVNEYIKHYSLNDVEEYVKLALNYCEKIIKNKEYTLSRYNYNKIIKVSSSIAEYCNRYYGGRV